MFGDHFYHSIIRKTVAVFGTLFNDISVVRKSGTGNIVDVSRVPLAYGPKQKFLARIDDEPNLGDPKVAIKLPRMSFEITNMVYDSAAKLSPFNKITKSDTVTNRTSVTTSVPYIINMQLSIMAKNQDDVLQIMEQILPSFQPTYQVAVKFVDGINETFDMPITLDSVAMTDDYEGDFTARRVIIYTLDFSLKVRFFGKETSTAVIKQVVTTFTNQDTNAFIETQVVDPVPTTATSQSTMTGITTAINFIPPNNVFSINCGTVSQDYPMTIGERIVGDTSGSGGVLVSQTFFNNQKTINLNFVDGYFLIGERITGVTSGRYFFVSSYNIG